MVPMHVVAPVGTRGVKWFRFARALYLRFVCKVKERWWGGVRETFH